MEFHISGAMAAVLAFSSCIASPAPGESSMPAGEVAPMRTRATFACRSVTEGEFKLARLESLVLAGRPSAAVDIDDSWRLVAYWEDIGIASDKSHMIFTQVMVTNGKRFNYIGLNWNGRYEAAGVEFSDGPEANRAVRKCIGDPQVQ
ncbi:hypothetical protein [Micropruina sp.]|uniref:hypothetical protein n=1 Tax=Micropruina sp. TaxID=2737536 RepID=UPI0039E49DBE